MEYITVFILILATQCIKEASAEVSLIQERLVNTTNVIGKTPFTTIAACSMKCLGHGKCSTVGFAVDTAVEKNLDCFLLEKVENYGIEERDDFVSLFVLIKSEETFAARKPDLPTCPIDGGYSDWSDFTTCSKSCGYGKHNRSRTCNNPFPRGTGANCSKLGNPTEQKTCNLKSCIVHGGFSEWSPWSSCSTTCRSGTVTRKRVCDNPTPKHGGNDCTGSKTESKSCTHLKKCVTDFCKSVSSGSSTTLELYDNNGNIEGSSTVICQFKDGYKYTLFSHNALSTRRFDMSNCKLNQTIVWDNGVSFVKKAVKQFQYCIQYFHFKVEENDPNISCFYSHDDRALCMSNSKCNGCGVIDNTDPIKQGRASVTDKTFFPFTGLRFADNDNSDEHAEIRFEQLRCR